ncbi:pectate lyase [Uliginosibacterium sp. H1]|uniref:pectate lyase n=1 Tax=Uliginosibacterium sp. H1 TaxID=3114757 RepID=UPI002E1971E2|nr:pectate lyase [Uliginosibacterium sp. H1]
MKTGLIWLMAIAIGALGTSSAFAANRPKNFTTICNEGKTCTVPPSTNVAFGRADQYYYKVLSGSFTCDAQTFGGRVAGGVNECSVPNTTCGLPGKPACVPIVEAYPGCEKPVATANVNLTSPIIVAAGQTFDGGNRRYTYLGDGSQGETMPPVFVLEDGATLKNVIVGASTPEGMVCKGNCNIEHTWWENHAAWAVRADGAAGTVVNLSCGAVARVENAVRNDGRSQVNISRFFVGPATRLYSSCGACTDNGGPRRLNLTDVITRGVGTIAAVNANYGDVATIRRLTLRNTTGSPTTVCRTFNGVERGQGAPVALAVEFGTASCDVMPADVTRIAPSQMTPATTQ